MHIRKSIFILMFFFEFLTQALISAQAQCLYSDNLNEGSLAPFWTAVDINANAAGSQTEGTALTITSEDNNITTGATSDSFRFIYQVASSDADITLKIDSVPALNGNGKIGIMMRNSLNANDSFACIFASYSIDYLYKWRTTSGAGSQQTDSGVPATFPCYVQLSRAASVFTGSFSTDDATWTTVNTQSVTMGYPYYVGIACVAADSTTPDSGSVNNFIVVSGDSCTSTPTNTPTVTPTPTPTSTSTPSPTPTSTDTPTITSTPYCPVYEAVVSSTAGNNVSSLSLSGLAVAGTNRLLLVQIALQSSSVTVHSISDSQGNTFILAGQNQSIVNNDRLEVYYANNPAASTDAITVIFSGAVSAYVGAVVYTGVNQSTPIGAVSSNAVTTPTLSGQVTITTQAVDGAIVGLFQETGNFTITQSGTQRWLQNSLGTDAIGDDLDDLPVTAVGNYSVTYTSSSAVDMTMLAVEVEGQNCQPTNTVTNTPTITLTPTRTPTLTITFTPTMTPTNTPTNSPTNTLTFTNTLTNTPTANMTATTGPTATEQANETATAVNTATEAPTATEQANETATAVDTATEAPTATTQANETATAVNTATEAPTATTQANETATAVNTATEAPTATTQANETATAVNTATTAPTATEQVLATQTAEAQATQTANPTVTNTPTESPTETYTLSPTATITLSPTLTTSATSTPTPNADLYLDVNYFNPNQSQLGMEVRVDQAGKVKITIFNLPGEEVKKIMDENKSVGNYRSSWNGKNNDGVIVGNGVYFIVLEQPNGHTVRKVIVLR